MEILSSYLIKSKDDYFNMIKESEENKYYQYVNKDNMLFDDIETCLIEHVEEYDYLTKEQEIKYKIFDDISSVTKNSNNKIELIIAIPKSSDILTINKIKLSKSIKKYIFDIFITLDNETILTKENLYTTKLSLADDIDELYENKFEKIIDCSRGEISIHIILEPQSINNIINNNIYISYSFINFKNKFKFLY